MSWYIARPGRAVGPFTTAEVREQIQAGHLHRYDRLAAPGDTKWRSAVVVFPDAFAPIAAWRWVIGLLVLVPVFAMLASAFGTQGTTAPGMTPDDLRAYSIGSVGIALALNAVAWFLLSGAAATAPRWRALRALAVVLGLSATLTLGVRLNAQHQSAAIADERFIYRLDASTPGVIAVHGEIGRQFAVDLAKVITPDTRTVEIHDSTGGLLEAGLAAADLVERNRLVVRVRGRCFSACVALYAASPKRQMWPQATIGLHRSADILSGAELNNPEQRAYEARLTRGGFPWPTVQKGKTTPASEMHTLIAARDRMRLPPTELIDPATGAAISINKANLLLVADIYDRDASHLSKAIGKTLRLVSDGFNDDLVEAWGVKFADAMLTGDGESGKTILANLTGQALRLAMVYASDEAIRAYWTFEGSHSKAAYERGEYEACGNVTDPTELLRFVEIKNELLRSANLNRALFGDESNAVAVSDIDRQQVEAEIMRRYVAFDVPVAESQKQSPRSICAINVAFAEMMRTAPAERLRVYAKINAE